MRHELIVYMHYTHLENATSRDKILHSFFWHKYYSRMTFSGNLWRIIAQPHIRLIDENTTCIIIILFGLIVHAAELVSTNNHAVDTRRSRPFILFYL